MDLPQPLSAQLDALTNALEDPGVDLQAIIAALAADMTAAVPSFLGLTMTLLMNGRPVTVTTIDVNLSATAGTSLQLPLDPLAGAAPGSSVVFYAGRPGAFVDLAADTRYAYGLDVDVVLDAHLDPLPQAAGFHPGGNGFGESTVFNQAVFNQAIGLLIGRGQLPEEAHDELLRRAADRDRPRFSRCRSASRSHTVEDGGAEPGAGK